MLKHRSHPSYSSEIPRFAQSLEAIPSARSWLRLFTIGVFTAVLLMTGVTRVHAQIALTTVAGGTNPGPVAVNPATNMIYVASFQDGTVDVINGATNVTVATVAVASPGAVAVNPVTNMIYVADTNANTVTVINGATNVASAPITVGTTPIAVAVNPLTNMIYVGNQTSNNVSIIDGSTDTLILTLPAGTNPQVIGVNPVTNKIYVVNNASNTVTVIDGSTNPQSVLSTVAVGTNALAIGVNPVTNLIYVANSGSANVTVINGAINTTVSTLTVGAGTQPRVLTVNPVSNKIYVANHTSGTVTVIDGTTNTTASNLTVTVGTAPVSLAVNPTTNQIYVANHTSGSGGGTLSVIDGTMNTTASTTTVPFAVGAFPVALAVNPVTNQIYAADQSSNDVTVFNGATNRTSTITVGSSSQANGTSIAANPATNKIYVPNSFSNTVTVINGATNATTTITTGIGTDVDKVAINPVTNLIYVTNLADATVSVIDGSTDTVTDVVTVGSSSQTNRTSIAVNPVTNKIYVPNSFSNTVTVIDGATNATSTITTGIGTDVDAVAVNPATNKIYVTNLADATVSVIDGLTESVTAVVAVGSSSQANGTSIAVNPVTNKIYVPNSFSNTVTVINGATNATTTITTGIGTDVDNIAVNPITNKIYVTNLADGTVSVINGSTDTVTAVVTVGSSSQTNRTSIAVNLATNKIYVPNSFTNTVTVIDGATNTTSTVTPGTDSNAVAVNLATSNIYVTNLADATVTAIAEEQVQPVPLTTAITPIPGNVTNSSTPTFTFTPTSTFAPTAPAIETVYFQLDTWEGPWIAATPGSGVFTGTASPSLQQGTHIVYAYATDGQQATSTGMTQQLVGAIAAEVFTVILPGSSTALTADHNPAVVGQTVTFTAAVTSAVTGTLTGAVTFYDGATSLGSTAVTSGVATFATAALTLGVHPITAVYSGDGNFNGSASAILSESIITPNPVPTVTSLSPTTATAGASALTLTVNGTNFVTSSLVQWNGAGVTTTFVSATQLTAVIPSSDLLTAGTAAVTVFNPTPGGGTSPSSLVFTINNPFPVLTSISPTTIVGGGSAITLTVNGSSFVASSQVKWNGAALATTYVSATQLTAIIPSSDLSSSGNASVQVFNPLPGGGTSASSITFIVTIPAPVLTTIAPNSALAGGAGFTLTLTGTAFISTSQAQWNGVALTTTFVSPTQLTAVVPAGDIATGGTASVVVFNPNGVANVVRAHAIPEGGGGPQGLFSNALTFTINNPAPVITSLSPSSALTGGVAFTLTVNGSNLSTSSTVQWNGVALATTYVSATQITALVPAADLLTAGTSSVTVVTPAPGGGTSSAITFTINNPLPALTSIAPNTAIAGGAAFTLTLNGSNFVAGTVVKWNGVALATTFVNATQLTALVPAGDIATGGTASVAVFSPTPGGGTSAAVTFTINNPLPTLGVLAPTSAIAGGPSFTITLTGTNFVAGTVVEWNGVALATTFISPTQISAVVPAGDIATGATVSVTAFNTLPGGGATGALTFTVNNPVPTETSLAPSSAIAGGAAFTLTVNGTNFVTGTVLQWNGVALTTTFISATSVSAAIPPADIATAGTALVTLFNPAPGGGTSISVNFAINNPLPTLTTLAPLSAIIGGPAFTLTLTGSNFLNGTVVHWNGVALATTFVSATQITALVPALDIQIAGTASVTVFNPTPGGGTSAAVSFSINEPVPTLAALSQISAIAGGPAFTLTLTGTNFVAGTVVQWNGAGLVTTFLTATSVSATIPATDIQAGGTASLTVFNPLPGGGLSAALAFTVDDPAPALAALSQTTVAAGSPGFTLTLTGSNFLSATVVEWNGVPLVTTFISATQLSAAVPASDIAAGGTFSITILNPAPGGGVSTAQTFTVTDFSVASTTPVQVIGAGQSAMFVVSTAPVIGPYPNTVTFTATGLPAGASATFVPASVTAGTATTMTITTVPRTTTAAAPPNFFPGVPAFPRSFPAWPAIFTMAILFVRLCQAKLEEKFRRRLVPLVGLVLLVLAVGYLSGCASGFPRLGVTSGTPAGTYTIKVTGTSGTDMHSTTVMMTVQ